MIFKLNKNLIPKRKRVVFYTFLYSLFIGGFFYYPIYKGGEINLSIIMLLIVVFIGTTANAIGAYYYIKNVNESYLEINDEGVMIYNTKVLSLISWLEMTEIIFKNKKIVFKTKSYGKITIKDYENMSLIKEKLIEFKS